MGRTVFLPCCLDEAELWAGIMEVVVTSFKRTQAHTVIFSAPDPPAGHCRPMPLLATDSWTLTGKSGSVSCVDTAPFSWLLLCTVLFVPPQESVSPVLWKFFPTGLQSQIPWGFSVPLLDLQVGKSVVGPGTFLTMREFLQSVGCMLGSFMMGIMATSSKMAYAACCVSQVCYSQSPYPYGRPLLTHAFTADTQRQVWLSLGGVSGSW